MITFPLKVEITAAKIIKAGKVISKKKLAIKISLNTICAENFLFKF